jgi:hypothetical protein
MKNYYRGSKKTKLMASNKKKPMAIKAMGLNFFKQPNRSKLDPTLRLQIHYHPL